MMRLLKRLRRRGRRLRMWRIVFSDEVGGCEVMEVGRTYRLTRKARALMCQTFTHFEIEQVV